jgi:hypothetical protein
MAIMLLISAIKLSVPQLKIHTDNKKMKRTEQVIVIHFHEDAENCNIPNAEKLHINTLLQKEEHGRSCMYK